VKKIEEKRQKDLKRGKRDWEYARYEKKELPTKLKEKIRH